MMSVNRIFARAATLGMLAVPALLSLGCVDEDVMELNVNTVAFCAKVTDAGAPVSGPVTINGTVLRRDLAYVWTYTGEGVLDSQGYGCMNLDNVSVANVWYIPREELL